MDTRHLYRNIKELLTLEGVAKNNGRRPTEDDLGIIGQAALVADLAQGTVLWAGKSDQIPQEYANIPQTLVENEIWLPQITDCHTHLVYGGHRHHDYALRCCGKTYQEIAAEGGGILSTMKETRAATLHDLQNRAEKDIDCFRELGVGTIEIKSGYGLTLESEIKMLETIRILQQQSRLLIVPTFLPAHATPPEFKGKTDDYVKLICNEWLPEMAKRKLAKYFDAFVEKGYFDVKQTRQMCEVAKDSGFGIKLHTDQFNDIGGTALGVELGAQSCDHLDNISDANIKKLAASDTVAVVCPGASLFTGTPYPPARKLVDQGARVAISTDYNPGTCPSRNLPLMTTLACSAMKMTVAEAIAGITYNAAAALGMEDQFGSLEPGKKFAVARLRIPSHETLPYCFGALTCET